MHSQRTQRAVTREKQETELIARGRDDRCAVPRGMSPEFCLSVLLLARSNFRSIVCQIVTHYVNYIGRLLF